MCQSQNLLMVQKKCTRGIENSRILQTSRLNEIQQHKHHMFDLYELRTERNVAMFKMPRSSS